MAALHIVDSYKADIIQAKDFLNLAFEYLEHQAGPTKTSPVNVQIDIRSFSDFAVSSYVLRYESLSDTYRECSDYICQMTNAKALTDLILANPSMSVYNFIGHIDLVGRVFANASAEEQHSCITQLCAAVNSRQYDKDFPKDKISNLIHSFCEISIEQEKSNSFVNSAYVNFHLQGYKIKEDMHVAVSADTHFDKLLSRYKELLNHPVSELRLATLKEIIRFYTHGDIYDRNNLHEDLNNFLENYRSGMLPFSTRISALTRGNSISNDIAIAIPTFWQNLCGILAEVRASDSDKQVQIRAGALLEIDKYYSDSSTTFGRFLPNVIFKLLPQALQKIGRRWESSLV